MTDVIGIVVGTQAVLLVGLVAARTTWQTGGTISCRVNLQQLQKSSTEMT